MREDGKVSKVAICENCNGFVIAAHIDHIDKSTEKDFTKASNEGFVVKLESIADTKSREWAGYESCKNGTCQQVEKV